MNAQMNMIREQIATLGHNDERILQAFKKVPKEMFVSDALKPVAYSEQPLSIGEGELLLESRIYAQILSALKLQGHETVLLVGTGSGYFTALIAALVQAVVSVDRIAHFNDAAKLRLKQLKIFNVKYVTADAYEGYQEAGKYDAMVFTGALNVESMKNDFKVWVNQMRAGGKIFYFEAAFPYACCYLLDVDKDGCWTRKSVFEADVPALVSPSMMKSFAFN